MKKGDFLFTYGTLRRGERADLAASARSFGASYIGEDAVNGAMYSLGSFPGAKLVAQEFDETSDKIVGDVFMIRDDSLVALLDTYEGYPYMYNRLVTKSSRGRDVWVYVYNDPCPDSSLIPSGDWKSRSDLTPPNGRKLRHDMEAV